MNQNKVLDTFTHNGSLYNLDKVKSLSLKCPLIYMDISKLLWVLKYDDPLRSGFKRVLRADIEQPLLVTQDDNGYVVVDGLHRLFKAYILELSRLPCRLIPFETLNTALIDVRE